MKKDRRTTRQYVREGDNALYLEEDEEELLGLSRKEVIAPLTEKERKFCEFYVHNFNIKTAAIKAGYTTSSANVMGWAIRKKYAVNRYICWLKLRLSKELHISAMDVVDMYARIAFADMADFVDITPTGRVKVKPAEYLDGQIIHRLKEGVQGIEVELEDRMRALQKIEDYFDIMPADWKQKIEERKVAIMEERLAMDKEDRATQKFEDDGFIEALTGVAEEIWDDEDDA